LWGHGWPSQSPLLGMACSWSLMIFPQRTATEQLLLTQRNAKFSCQWLCSYCRSNLSCSSSRCSWPRSRSFWVSNSQIMVKSTFSEFLPTFHYLMMTVLIFIFLISVELVKSGDCWSKKVHEIFNQFLSAWWLLSRAISSHTSRAFFPVVQEANSKLHSHQPFHFSRANQRSTEFLWRQIYRILPFKQCIDIWTSYIAW